MKINKKQEVFPLMKVNYLSSIKNSVGSVMFRNFYAKVNGKKVDIMKNGDLSCAFYVSSILKIFDFIGKIHGTVDSTVKDLQQIGWKPSNSLKPGYVIIWEKKTFENNEPHKHIGFYIGKNKAVSNSDKKKSPVAHDVNFNNTRKIELILSFDSLKLN